jgi:hypothetical protein
MWYWWKWKATKIGGYFMTYIQDPPVKIHMIEELGAGQIGPARLITIPRIEPTEAHRTLGVFVSPNW